MHHKFQAQNTRYLSIQNIANITMNWKIQTYILKIKRECLDILNRSDWYKRLYGKNTDGMFKCFLKRQRISIYTKTSAQINQNKWGNICKIRLALKKLCWSPTSRKLTIISTKKSETSEILHFWLLFINKPCCSQNYTLNMYFLLSNVQNCSNTENNTLRDFFSILF